MLDGVATPDGCLVRPRSPALPSASPTPRRRPAEGKGTTIAESRVPRRDLHSSGARSTRRLLAALDAADRRGIPLDEVLGESEARRAPELSRRAFLARGAAVGAAAALGPRLLDVRSAGPRVVIVGAGLAGIRAAHALWTGDGSHRGGVRSSVFEADTTHLGGRCWSLRGFFDDGLIGEHGGSFINTDQHEIRRLAASLGLQEEVVNGGSLPEGHEVFWFDGHRYRHKDAEAFWQETGHRTFRDAYHVARYPQLYNRNSPGGRRLDRMSVPEWLDHNGIGASSSFGKLMQSNVVSEYGGDPGEQSALNLLYLLAWNKPRHLDPLPGYDEMLHIVGGNDQIVSGMVSQLPAGTVRRGYELVALSERGLGYRLTFRTDGGRHIDVGADHVVLALPFTALRRADLSHAGLSALKLRAIRELGMGQNAKLHIEVKSKTWWRERANGSAYTDWDRFCVCWDDSVPLGPHGSPAILLGFPGGRTARSKLRGNAHGPAPGADVDWFLSQVEPIFPGTTAAYTGRAWEDHWSADPWHRGAYSYWRRRSDDRVRRLRGRARGRHPLRRGAHRVGPAGVPQRSGGLGRARRPRDPALDLTRLPRAAAAAPDRVPGR